MQIPGGVPRYRSIQVHRTLIETFYLIRQTSSAPLDSPEDTDAGDSIEVTIASVGATKEGSL